MRSQNYKKLSDPAYIEPFFVGLLEGDGSIIVSKSGKNSLKTCFVIKLKNGEHNKTMLQYIQMHIGGPKIREEHVKNGNNKIVWEISAKKDIANILNILKRYPLLSSRKICQLEFLKRCLDNRSVLLPLCKSKGSMFYKHDLTNMIISKN